MRALVRTLLLLVEGGMVVLACSSSSTGNGETSDAGASDTGPSDAASQTVGPDGGTVTAADGTQVVIPPGALSADVTITIGVNEQAPLLTQAQALATAHVFGPEGQTFLKPVRVTLAFQNLPSGIPESAVVVYTAPKASSAYQPLPTAATDSSHVTATTTHFSNMLPAIANPTDAGGVCGTAGTCAAGDICCLCPLVEGGGGGYECKAAGATSNCGQYGCGQGSCDATSCPSGCCDGNGLCQAGTTDAACGNGGQSCFTCTSPLSCGGGGTPQACGMPDAGPTVCGTAGTCATGDICCLCALVEGGGGGYECKAAGATSNCGQYGCGQGSCDATSCPSGCCDGNGFCQAGTTDAACGSGGQSCVACTSPLSCGGGGTPQACGMPDAGPTVCGTAGTCATGDICCLCALVEGGGGGDECKPAGASASCSQYPSCGPGP